MTEKKQKDYVNMTVKELTKLMAGPSPIKRKNAAKELLERVKQNPESFKKNIPDFIDALSRPEAQTRWLALDSLSTLVPVDTKACKGAIEGAEEALFDEKTSLIRESAMRFLSRYGATSMQRSKEVWPLIKDALQQYHGEVDYDKLLNRVTFFASGKLDPVVKKDFRAVTKDIMNSVGGATKERLNRILLVLKGQKISRPKISKSDPKKADEKKSNSKKTEKKKKTENKVDAKKSGTKKTTKKIDDKKKIDGKANEKKKSTKKVDTKKKPATKTKKDIKKDTKKKVDKKMNNVKKKAVKKAAKTVISKPKAKTKVGKKVEDKKKKVAKKVVKKAVKKEVKKAVKKGVKKVAKKAPAKKKPAAKKATQKNKKKK